MAEQPRILPVTNDREGSRTGRAISDVSARHRSQGGFTLIEAMVSIAITAIAGSALLMGIHTSLQATGESLGQTIAGGLAEQLMDEILGQPYDDIDDYNGLRRLPPADAWGIALGKDDGEGGLRHANFQVTNRILDNWRQEVDVYYVDESDPSTPLPAGQTSDYRMVEVRIVQVDPDRGNRQLATLRRVVAYVPPM